MDRQRHAQIDMPQLWTLLSGSFHQVVVWTACVGYQRLREFKEGLAQARLGA